MIKQETDLFAADMDFSLSNAGPITKFFLGKLLEIPYVSAVYQKKIPGLQLILDTRTHVLKEGEQPAIPGWHTDFAERTPATKMQPDYSKITPSVKTYVINYSDHPKGVSNTEYLKSKIDLLLPQEQVYQYIDTQLTSSSSLVIGKVADGDIMELDQLSLHRGTPAHNNGMRGFMRLAVLHDLKSTILQDKPQNEHRNQIQSYLEMGAEIKSRDTSQKHLLEASYEFLPSIQTFYPPELFELQKAFTVKQIKSEPIIVNGSMSYAFEFGGSLTRQFLKAIQTHPLIKDIINKNQHNQIKINTQVHMLMKGQSPDLTLWRSGAPFQEMIHPNLKGKHFILLLSSKESGVSDMEFCTVPQYFKTEAQPSLEEIERSLKTAKTQVERLTDRKLMTFDGGTLHRALPAHNSGWRLALMASIDPRFIQNETKKQSRVYLEDISLGW